MAMQASFSPTVQMSYCCRDVLAGRKSASRQTGEIGNLMRAARTVLQAIIAEAFSLIR
jgi:hypothetical protein